MVNSKWIRRFAVWTAALLAAIAAVVVIFDPFYHFHGPLPGMKAVVTKSEYQCIGTIRNFSYDSVLACLLYTSTFETTFYRVTSEKIGENIRAVVLSDLHNNVFGQDNERLC